MACSADKHTEMGRAKQSDSSVARSQAPSGVTQRPIYVLPGTDTPFNLTKDGPAHFKEGYEA